MAGLPRHRLTGPLKNCPNYFFQKINKFIELTATIALLVRALSWKDSQKSLDGESTYASNPFKP
jgi:hypothetical protein